MSKNRNLGIVAKPAANKVTVVRPLEEILDDLTVSLGFNKKERLAFGDLLEESNLIDEWKIILLSELGKLNKLKTTEFAAILRREPEDLANIQMDLNGWLSLGNFLINEGYMKPMLQTINPDHCYLQLANFCVENEVEEIQYTLIWFNVNDKQRLAAILMGEVDSLVMTINID